MSIRFCAIALGALLAAACSSQKVEEGAVDSSKLAVSEDGRFLKKGEDPFFWLGDTGWLAPEGLNREEVDEYLSDRQEKGFNVVQISVLHGIGAVNHYGDSAVVNLNAGKPKITEGSNPDDAAQYDYWDHVDYIVEKAAEKDIYIAVVPVWGNNVKNGKVSREEAKSYASFLAERYKDNPNIIWLNGGDVFGSDSLETWKIIGKTINEKDTNHLITFHPRGRTQSSKWFHNEPWLDFNMFQSGHRRYDQDTASHELRYGEDNWRYIQADYAMVPAKPTLDGEPSYEGIPQGLHDPKEPFWTDDDVRRYGYWSVFAGGAGYTYGHNAVMQMQKDTTKMGAFGNRKHWKEALDDPGAGQMVHMKELMLSRPYFERVPDQSLVAEQGERYDYQTATRGTDYAFIYTYNGRDLKINMGKIEGEKVKASWFNPRTGEITEIGEFPNNGVADFNPPGEKEGGNDWVLILDKA